MRRKCEGNVKVEYCTGKERWLGLVNEREREREREREKERERKRKREKVYQYIIFK